MDFEIFSKKGCFFLVLSGKKQILPLFPPRKISQWPTPWKNLYDAHDRR